MYVQKELQMEEGILIVFDCICNQKGRTTEKTKLIFRMNLRKIKQ